MWIGIIVGSLSCYALKLTGLSVPKRLLENQQVRKLAALLPVALLAALTVTQAFSTGRHIVIDARAVGLGVAILAVYRRAPFLAVVALAAASAALVRLIA